MFYGLNFCFARSLSQAWEKYREDSTAREKKLAEELNTIKRNSQKQRNQLQQCEHQLAWHREELEKLRGKAEILLKEVRNHDLKPPVSTLTLFSFVRGTH